MSPIIVALEKRKLLDEISVAIKSTEKHDDETCFISIC